MSEPLWRPSAERVAQSNLKRFSNHVIDKYGADASDYAALHQWSIDQRDKFWDAVWDFAGIIARKKGERVQENGDRMPGARWFPQAELNFAENLLRRRDGETALIFYGENAIRRDVSFSKLYELVSRLSRALRAAGVAPGDRVAGYLPNMPETIMAMLAATSIGATFSSCSPDFGVRGVVDRFGQIEPKILFCADGYYYNGKRFDSLGRIPEILKQIPSIERVVVASYSGESPDLGNLDKTVGLEDFAASQPAGDIEFEQLPFDHPVYIMFSSGTTGAPKCIVHGAGGTLIQHLKEHQLHVDLKSGDCLTYFTTCGWMMWNWLVTGLASGATLVLYDGSPFYPDGNRLFDIADEIDLDIFGTSAKFIDSVKKAGLEPKKSHNLGALRSLLSTGSPLLPESFDFVYQSIKEDLCLSSITGGTDIVSCFALGNATLPVYRGEIQCLGLGMKVQVYDDDGRPVIDQQGELVCTAPFPSMPVGFWNDPDGSRYRGAYFEKYPNVWCHGDYVRMTQRGGLIVYGRSDAVLNPGGVRIGTAEIYRQVEQLEEALESLVIGQDWEGDVRVVLFVVLREGVKLDDALRKKIRDHIRANTTPRHVPARVVQVADIPRTKSNKITELAVRDIVHGREVKNKEALANPEALELYRNLPELQS
ncbi:MAG: acetoacetate--CoA ligase [Gammaproteobacteria bacterium]|nr:acetoacetate--CoA ligase [Gammaproteobacteria bacterium]